MKIDRPFKAEYIWLDGYQPEPNLRSKTKIIASGTMELHERFQPDAYPSWSFDGSSTQQADGHFSDCLLTPIRVVPDPLRDDSVLVLCEVLLPSGEPHPSNTRSEIEDDEDMWFGFEQEYVLYPAGGEKPLGFPTGGYPEGQGKYYCGVGAEAVVGRDIVEAHLDACMACGLNVTGINAEVMLGQWEFQLLGKGTKNAGDELWLARYLLYRVAEKHSVKVELHPKPVKGDWNGSGMHCNFSNTRMREKGDKSYFDTIFKVLAKNHDLHIQHYGSSNDERLTGKHETSPITEFTYGVSDRGCSIRIPLSTGETWTGYLEDRRPASNADPYKIAKVMKQSFVEVDQAVAPLVIAQ
ncbi:MAG: glutamine synthetase beta-grasp domain-containing protein [Armatimonadetes bacterium]|nr:glutamine synthetase beta-grasp domain-containing protein [Armatimonadota bacterium]